MNVQPGKTSGPTRALFAIAIGLIVVPFAATTTATAAQRGRAVARAPHFSAPRMTFHPPRMTFRAPRAQFQMPFMPYRAPRIAPTRTMRTMRIGPSMNASRALAANRAALAARQRQLAASRTSLHNMMRSQTAARARNLAARRSLGGYRYRYGNGVRRYRPYGYGRGYRRNYYGRRYGYGRSQRYNRAIVGRLLSVYRSLARLDRDYGGHRARAMWAVSMAVRQLSHQSMIYSGIGFAPRMNARPANAGARNGAAKIPQAQSDARMSMALRTLQGAGIQLANQGVPSPSRMRANGFILRAIHEIQAGLMVR